MPERPVRPIRHHAALLLPGTGSIGPELAVADLHLGLGSVGAHGGGLASSVAAAMAEELLTLGASERARGVIVLGDAKHPLVGAPTPVGRLIFDFFSRLLDGGLRVRIVPGNHDFGLARHLPREVELLTVGGLRRGPLGLIHGHARPAPGLFGARTLVAGHLHPGYRLAPGEKPGEGKQRCWVRAALAPGTVGRAALPLRAREMIVLPAFNPLSGIEPLNARRPSAGRTFLLDRFLLPGTARAYLLDGTDLGRLTFPRSVGPVAPDRIRTVGDDAVNPGRETREPPGRSGPAATDPAPVRRRPRRSEPGP
ncbi:MAG: hypothetical protein ACYDFT_08340 [Thermoplasmata archaeon]